MINSRKCTGCHMCELVCSAYHEESFRPSVASLFARVDLAAGTIKGHTCLQTGCAKCEEICPQNAIFREELVVTVEGDFDGREKIGGGTVSGLVLIVDESKCSNCGECYDICPTGVIREHPDRKVAYKCDLCGGQPQCIAFCQNPQVLAVDLRVDKADRQMTVEAR